MPGSTSGGCQEGQGPTICTARPLLALHLCLERTLGSAVIQAGNPLTIGSVWDGGKKVPWLCRSL